MNPHHYCREKVFRQGSSLYYSQRQLSTEQQQALTALHALCRELDDAVDECSEAIIAQQKLEWWRGELERLYAGQPNHPVTQALQPALEPYALPLELFQQLIEAREMDLRYSSYRSFDDLQTFLSSHGGSREQLNARLYGGSVASSTYALQLGSALQLIATIRDLHRDLQRGRLYLPLEELEAVGLSATDLINHQPGSTPTALTPLLQKQAKRAKELLQQAEAQLPDSERPQQQAGLIYAQLKLAALAEAEQDGFQVLQRRISLTPLRRLWLTWRTRRREQKRVKQPPNSPSA